MQQAFKNKRKTRVIAPTFFTRVLFLITYLPLVALMVSLSACVPDAGIFAGGAWQAGGLPHQHIRVLAVDPNNPQALYAGDAQGNILVTKDAAQHWIEHSTGLPMPNSIHALSFDATGKKLYTATAQGIYVSSDAAQHWNAIAEAASALPIDSYTAITFDLNAPHIIYVGSAHHGIYTSSNDGTTWTSENIGLPADITINNLTYDSDQHQLWAATSQGIYRWDSKGTTWQAFNNGLPSSIVIYTVQPNSINLATPGLVFAGTDNGIFLSQDSGSHWSTSKTFLTQTNIRAVMVDFRKPTTIYVGSDIGVFRSLDSGQTWGSIAPGLPAKQPVYALVLGATGYAQLYAATNDVYLFPGNVGGFSASRLVPLLFIVLLFYLLYRITRHNRNNRRTLLKPERIIEHPLPEYADNPDRSNNT